MNCVFFVHSLLSDWNHGNAHFLRGITTELALRGHGVGIYEPADSWSRTNLVGRYGEGVLHEFSSVYPSINSILYDNGGPDLDIALDQADLVIVHEWNDPNLVGRIGEYRRQNNRFKLLFHDTHHRSVTAPQTMRLFDLSNYDGVLAFGAIIRDIYLQNGWTGRAWTFHEAADIRIFHPAETNEKEGDVVWIGNWGDEERTAELEEFLFGPVQSLNLRTGVYGVRYPGHTIDMLARRGIGYRGWLPNYRVPGTFARYRATVHVPRRPYAQALRGIPTIRPFEALACGIPLISAPWEDSEGLFTEGKDYLMARNGKEMGSYLRAVVEDGSLAKALSENGRSAILAGHTCGHRIDRLLGICEEIGIGKEKLFPVKTTREGV